MTVPAFRTDLAELLALELNEAKIGWRLLVNKYLPPWVIVSIAVVLLALWYWFEIRKLIQK